MTEAAVADGIPSSLLERIRSVELQIAWRPAGRGARIAHLFQEEARVETQRTARRFRIKTDSGPVGALLLLLEIDRRGPPSSLASENAGLDPAFRSGALRAEWGGGALPVSSTPVTVPDLVELARYALP